MKTITKTKTIKKMSNGGNPPDGLSGKIGKGISIGGVMALFSKMKVGIKDALTGDSLTEEGHLILLENIDIPSYFVLPTIVIAHDLLYHLVYTCQINKIFVKIL